MTFTGYLRLCDITADTATARLTLARIRQAGNSQLITHSVNKNYVCLFE